VIGIVRRFARIIASSVALGSALALALSPATGCTLVRQGTFSGPPPETEDEACDEDADCSGDPSCQTPACVEGVCEYRAKPLGEPCGVTQERKCDGMGVCVDCLGAGDCQPGACLDGVKEGGERCEDGLCVPNDSISCFPYACNDAGDNCRSDCATNGVNDCAEDYLCNEDDVCVESFSLGHPCAAGQCESGFCVDGKCCEAACDATCEACAEMLTGMPDGTCAAVPPFTDPDGDCAEAIGCDDAGMCAACGFSPEAPGAAQCPAECDTCSMTAPFICTIVCDSDAAATNCDGQTVTCPPGWDCEVQCINQQACRDAEILCPDDHRCVVDCADVDHACQRMNVTCTENGPCRVDCGGGNTCKDAELACGNNECRSDCSGDDDPIMTDTTGEACGIGCDP
jgi:hypothetical protein